MYLFSRPHSQLSLDVDRYLVDILEYYDVIFNNRFMTIERAVRIPKKQSCFLLGPRQTGKSTLLRSLFPAEECLYYDLLRSEEYYRLSAEPSALREEVLSRGRGVRRVIIDEVQRIPELLNEVQFLIERRAGVQFLLSSSSARKLKRSHANLLAGRAVTRYLFPLTSGELGDNFSLSKSLQYGSLPAVYLDPSAENRMDILRTYVDSYLREEVEMEAQVRQIGTFVRFLQYASSENGNTLNYSNIARETGTSSQTIRSYFQILEDTLIGFFLLPYSRSQRKRLSMHPKFYFFDTGVVRALSGKLTVPLHRGTIEYGRVFEHFLILEVARMIHYLRKDCRISHYRTEAGAEVDLIVETPRGTTIAIEIKGTDRIASAHLRGLRSFSEDCRQAKLICACLVPARRTLGSVTVLPWQELLQTLAASS